MKRDWFYLLLHVFLIFGCFMYTGYIEEHNLFNDRFYLALYNAAYVYIGVAFYWIYLLEQKYKIFKNKSKK